MVTGEQVGRVQALLDGYPEAWEVAVRPLQWREVWPTLWAMPSLSRLRGRTWRRAADVFGMVTMVLNAVVGVVGMINGPVEWGLWSIGLSLLLGWSLVKVHVPTYRWIGLGIPQATIAAVYKELDA